MFSIEKLPTKGEKLFCKNSLPFIVYVSFGFSTVAFARGVLG